MLTTLAFVAIYFTTRTAAIQASNAGLREECEHVRKFMVVDEKGIWFSSDEEWEESEHAHTEVNPTFLQISGADGSVIRYSKNLEKSKLPLMPGIKKETFRNLHFLNLTIRVVQQPVFDKYGVLRAYIVVGIPFGEALTTLEKLKSTLLLFLPLVIVLLFGVTYLVAGSSIAPVNQVISIARLINAENLDAQIPLPENKDEIYTLTETLNSMIVRIAELIRREQQFTADVSHELRTPLAIIRGKLELLSLKQRSAEEVKEKVVSCIQETDRLNNVINQLLLVARCEAGQLILNPHPVETSQFVQVIADRLNDIAKEKKVVFDIGIQPGWHFFQDPALVEIIVQNIMENAVKFAGKNSVVTIRAKQTDAFVSLSVNNKGITIPKEEIDRIFNRYFRSGQTAASIQGSGLGLAIVQRVAKLTNTEIQLVSNEADGTTFTVLLPSAVS